MVLASILAPPFVGAAGLIGFICSLLISFLVDRLVSRYRKTIRRQNDRLNQHVAELEILSSELAQRNEEALAYARTVAHDLRNPLTVVGSANEVLKTYLLENSLRDPLPSEKERRLTQTPSQDASPPGEPPLQAHLALELCAAIAAASHTMSSIIDDLLSLADYPQKVVFSDSIDAHSSATRAIKELAYVTETKGATIELGESWPSAEGYEPWIDRVWTNLIYNALEHGGVSPYIKIDARRHSFNDRSMVRFSVTDDGPGIAEAEQGRLFHERPYSDRTSQVHGLGLWIVRRIVERLDGRVGVDSNQGQGSTFWFDLVAGRALLETSPEPVRPAQPIEQRSPLRSGTQSERVAPRANNQGTSPVT